MARASAQCPPSRSHILEFRNELCSLLRLEPDVPSFAHIVIIIQMRIGLIYAVNLFTLTRAESFIGVEAPDTFQQALSAQDFMQPGDTAGETIRRVEKRGVTISHFYIFLEETFGNWVC